MADSSKNMKYIIVVLVVVALLVISYFVYKSIPTKGVTKNAPTEESSPGLLGIIAGLFGIGKGSSSGGGIKGGDVKSFACKIFPKLCEPKGSGGSTGGGELSPYTCDCGNVGYTTDGDYQADCEYNGTGYTKDCR